MDFGEMIRMLGNIRLKLPYPLLAAMNGLMWRLHATFITEFPSLALNMTVFPWIASNNKLKRDLGYTFKYTTKEAFADFARHVKSAGRPLPSPVSAGTGSERQGGMT